MIFLYFCCKMGWLDNQPSEGGLSLDSRLADREKKVVTPENLCHYLCQKSWNPNSSYSEPNVFILLLKKKPSWLKCKNYFILKNSQFCFLGTLLLVLSRSSNPALPTIHKYILVHSSCHTYLI